MFIGGMLGWWYLDGWKSQISRVIGVLRKINDTFSIPLLLRTFFAPFKQISADTQGGDDLASKFKAWSDRAFSRMIGAVMRFFMIIFGVIALFLGGIVSIVRLILWPVMPLMPIIGFILMFSIGVPWKII